MEFGPFGRGRVGVTLRTEPGQDRHTGTRQDVGETWAKVSTLLPDVKTRTNGLSPTTPTLPFVVRFDPSGTPPSAVMMERGVRLVLSRIRLCSS